MQVDPKAEHDISTSPYVAHYNSPINFSDPLGDCPLCPLAKAVGNFIASSGILLPEVTITATAVVSATAVSKAAFTASAIVATLPTVLPEYVWPLYDQFIESGYTTAPYQRYTFFESEPGNSGRTMHVEHTLRSNDQGDLSIKNTFYRWYDSFELLEKLGGPTGVVEMVPNLMPVKAAGSSISKSLTIVAAKVSAMRVTYSDDLVKAAEKLYPKKIGKFEKHHPFPKYMGGAEKQNLIELPGPYHQQITNEFYKYWPKKLPGQPKVYPTAQQAQEIMQKVYSKFPLPGN